MWNEFRTFIARGSVVELAVGIVLGASFGTVIDSFVNDLLMPPIGVLTGGADFSELYISLTGEEYPSLAAAREAGAPTINYGLFVNSIVSFLIVGFAVFLFIRSYNRLREQRESIPAKPPAQECPFCRFSIPLRASRCAHCTSTLPEPSPPAER